MRPKSLVLLMLALGCGLVASIGISQVMDRRNQPVVAGEMDAIFVAVQDIGFGDALNMQNLKLEQWPKDKIPPGALAKLEDVEGKRAGTKLYAGEPVLEGKLMGSGDQDGPSIAIPRGFRVVSVQVDATSSIGGLIKPSDRVDVLVYIRGNSGNGITESGTKTILQDIRVFAVNEQWKRPEEKTEEVIPAKTVSLLVTPTQAEKVTLAAELGNIRLVMRSPDDQGGEEVSAGITAGEIFGQSSEKTNRDAEGGEPAGPAAEPTDGLLAWLTKQGSQQTEAAPVDAAAPAASLPVERFMMEVLEGNELRNVEFTKGQGADARWQNGANMQAAVAAPVVPQQTVPQPAADKNDAQEDEAS